MAPRLRQRALGHQNSAVLLINMQMPVKVGGFSGRPEIEQEPAALPETP